MSGTRRTALADTEPGNQQQLVNERFDSHAQDWDELYQKENLFSVIIRHRHDRALGWIDDLELPAGSRVLEIGPGAGLMTAALARRGFRVAGADSAPRMIEIARRRADQAVTTQASYPDQGETTAGAGLMLADAHRLPFAAETFSLVVALGVVPWLNSAQVAADEMARVLRPGGYLLLNASNRHRLSLLLDPWHCPALDRPRAGAKRALTAAGIRRPAPRPAITAHRLGEFDQILVRAGLRPRRACTVGFGPFTLLRFPVLPDRLGVRVNARIQQLTDRGTPGLRRAGNHYLVLARRLPE
jgi:ubiquinone/menaquinone biosynthesis C-methylase UbiE